MPTEEILTYRLPGRLLEIGVLHNDDDLLVIAKPSGLLTIPDRYDRDAPSLNRILARGFGRLFVIHRLDSGTSGALVFAKNAAAHRFVNQQFQEHKVNKIYHAVVTGSPADEPIEIDIPITASPAKKGTSIPSARGKQSLTIVKVLERYRSAALLECRLVTGRHHQLRVHLAAIGNPLLVDDVYGAGGEFYLSTIKRRYNLKRGAEEKPVISRLTMHAYILGFLHPATLKHVEFTAPYPKDFRALLSVLRKYAGMPAIPNSNVNLSSNLTICR